jgi:hypothetical protein
VSPRRITRGPRARIAARSPEARHHRREKRGQPGHLLRRHEHVFVRFLDAGCRDRVSCVSHTHDTAAALLSRRPWCLVGVYVEHALHLVAHGCRKGQPNDHGGTWCCTRVSGTGLANIIPQTMTLASALALRARRPLSWALLRAQAIIACKVCHSTVCHRAEARRS